MPLTMDLVRSSPRRCLCRCKPCFAEMQNRGESNVLRLSKSVTGSGSEGHPLRNSSTERPHHFCLRVWPLASDRALGMESPPTDRLRLIDAMFVDACVSRRARELAASTPPPSQLSPCRKRGRGVISRRSSLDPLLVA